MEAPLALYRRYRPETFAEVIGQDHVTAPLRNALSNNRVNHAYLFSGPRGCGKTTSARILARAINCEKGPIAEPCGVCKSCTDLARGGPGSIDVIEIDAASHGGVDDARDLRERAFFAPVESRYKIYIIDEAHMVTTQGFNALLKLVEEPPPHLKFIFATTEPDKVIGTIRSRTHHYPFRLVPPKALADYMATLCQAEGVSIEPAALPLVVRAGAGSVRDSLSVLDQLIGGAGPAGVTYELAVALLGFTPDSLLDACVDGFAAHDSAAVFETVEKVIETGQDPKRFAEDLLRRLRDLVVLSAVPTAVTSGLIEAAEDQAERLQTQAAGIGAAELTRAADIVAEGLLDMRGATAPRLQLELICAKVLLPGADDSTNGIQARLDRMERRLAIGVPGGTAEAGAVGGGTPDSAQASAGTPGAAATSRAAARAAATSGNRSAPTEPPAAAQTPGGPDGNSAPVGTSPVGTSPVGTAPGGAGPGGPAGVSDRAGGGAGHAGEQSTASQDGGGAESTGSLQGTSGGATESASDGSRGPAGVGAESTGSSQGASGGAAGSAGGGSRGAAGRGAESAGGGSAGASGGGARTGAWGDEPVAQVSPPAQAGPAAQAGSPVQASSPAQSVQAPAAGGVGAVGLGDIRRLWPEVLEAVKAQRRFAWIMLSQNAQVIAIDDQTLTLGLVNAGARESFARSGSDEILRQAMIDTIGVDRRVEAVVDPSTDPGAGGGGSAGRPGPQSGGPGNSGGSSPQPGGGGPAVAGPSSPTAAPSGAGTTGSGTDGPAARGPGTDGSGAAGPAADGPGAGRPGPSGSSAGGSSGPETGGAGVSSSGVAAAAGLVGGAAAVGGAAGAVALQEPPDSEYDVPPEDPWEDGPVARPSRQQAGGVEQREPAGSKRRAAEAAVAAEQKRQAASAAAAAPEVPLTPEEEADSIGEDDMVLEEDSRSHTDLLRETLGAQIITEEPN
ncbi:DNA polymerase III subunit gamma and tau [Kribbella speibonae]|uniref:DNA-directed DNA polymerase n=1 Tax=Kribbella speibonae TaxID=1572660 RepID=A0A4R0IKM4_9ACTN|nr:DNA polymerase III subunit gamma and tau [Kribbella speibonae]TCC31698.1 DNA polymerase III subunit gamma and tau [Kribbella speibonae]